MQPQYTPDVAPTKQCTKCHEWLPVTSEYFYRSKNTQDGFKYDCKKCRGSKFGPTRSAPPPPLMEGYRVCIGCLQEKPETAEYFYRNKAGRKGLCPRCKICDGKKPTQIIREGHKVCARCKEEKPATADYFHRAADSPDGLRWTCKQCVVKRYISPSRDGYKRCTRCLQEKPATVDYFTQDRKRDDGLFSWCKVCKYKNDALIRSKKPPKSREWKLANRDKFRQNKSRRRARKLQSIGTHTVADIKRQYKSQRGRCYYCSVKVGDNYHVDHVIPLSRGGSDGPENLVIACPPCNHAKRNRMPHEWIGSNRLL